MFTSLRANVAGSDWGSAAELNKLGVLIDAFDATYSYVLTSKALPDIISKAIDTYTKSSPTQSEPRKKSKKDRRKRGAAKPGCTIGRLRSLETEIKALIWSPPEKTIGSLCDLRSSLRSRTNSGLNHSFTAVQTQRILAVDGEKVVNATRLQDWCDQDSAVPSILNRQCSRAEKEQKAIAHLLNSSTRIKDGDGRPGSAKPTKRLCDASVQDHRASMISEVKSLKYCISLRDDEQQDFMDRAETIIGMASSAYQKAAQELQQKAEDQPGIARSENPRSFTQSQQALDKHIAALRSRPGSAVDAAKRKREFNSLREILSGYSIIADQTWTSIQQKMVDAENLIVSTKNASEPDDLGSADCRKAFESSFWADQERVKSLIAAAKFADITIDRSQDDKDGFRVSQEEDGEWIRAYGDEASLSMEQMKASDGSRYADVTDFSQYLRKRYAFSSDKVSQHLTVSRC